MPTRVDPYDFSDMPVSIYDFKDMPRGLPSSSRLNDPVGRALIESGLMTAEDVDPFNAAAFTPEPASSTSVAGVRTESPAVVPSTETPQENPFQMFMQKMSELNLNPHVARSGLAGPVAALGTAAEVVSGTVGQFRQKATADMSLAETGFGLIKNAAAGLMDMYPALAQLPEAMLRDPSGTMEALLEFVPHQAMLLWKASVPAGTKEEQEQKRLAQNALFEDPLGAVFAALIVGGLTHVSVKTIKKYKAASAIAKFEVAEAKAFAEAEAKAFAEAEAKAFAEAEAADLAYRTGTDIYGDIAKSRAEPAPPPNVPTRSLTTSVETPPPSGQPITDPSRLIGMAGTKGEVAGPVGEGQFFTKPKLYGRGRIPEERAVESAQYGGPEFSETAGPLGGESRFFEGDVPPRTMGTAPEGNFMDFIARLKGANGYDVTSGKPPKPPRYQPFLRSGQFTESKILDEKFKAANEPSILESAHPHTVVPEISATPAGVAEIDVQGWMKRRIARQQRIFAVMTQFGKRLTIPEAKAAVAELQAMNMEANQYAGNIGEDFRGVGSLLQRPGPGPALQRKWTGTKVFTMEEWMARPEVRALYIKMGQALEDAGVTMLKADGTTVPFKMSEDFLRTGPQRWKLDILEKIWDDVGGAVDAARGAAKTQGQSGNIAWIDNYLNKTSEDLKSMKQSTQDAVKALIDAKAAKTTGQALRMLADESSNQMFRRTGVEFPRTRRMPDYFLETNPAILTGRYIGEWSRTLAEVNHFGPARGRLADIIARVEKADPREGAMLRDLSDVMMGVVDRSHPISYGAHKASRIWANATYGVKIGAGWAPMIQVTQPLISIIPDAGLVRVAQGTWKALHPVERALLRRTGTVGTSAFRKMMGSYGSAGPWSYIPTTQFFSFANRALDYVTGATGEVFARDLHRIANLSDDVLATPIGKLRRDWARTKLQERFGMDYTKAIEQSDFIKITQKYANELQLHPDAAVEPKFLNMPNTRWLGVLKRFVYKQTILSRDMIWNEIKKGNVFPLARLAAGGLLGGDIALRAKDKVQEMISGKHKFRDDDPFWQQIPNRYAVIGTLGMISDLGWIDEDNPALVLPKIYEGAAFEITPVLLSDITRGGSILFQEAARGGKELFGSEKQKAELDWKNHLGELGSDAVAVLGTFGYQASSQMRSDKTESAQSEYVYKQRLSAARRAYWGGNKAKAYRIRDEWNKYRHQYPMLNDQKRMAAGRKITDEAISDIRVKETYQ